ncbi:MAG: hypothetical protein ACREBU_13775 [Nitrososphaera sp.]
MRVEVIFHVGLHKTGTTSFQAALTKAGDTLISGGILYPAPPSGGVFTAQHADIPLMLIQGRLNEVRAYFDGVLEQARTLSNPKIETILFSSEDFSSLYFDKPAFSALADIANEKFQLFNALLVLRNIVDLTASELRQQIDGGRLSPRQAMAQDEVLRAFLRTIRKVKFLTTHFHAVKVLDYEDARASGHLNNYFAKALFGSQGPNLENLRLNVGQERDEQIVGLLSAQLRGLVSMVRNSHTYSRTVRNELERIIDFDRIKTSVRREHAKEFAISYDAYVRKVVSEVFVRQKPKIDGEMTSLAPLHRDMLVRGLPAP